MLKIAKIKPCEQFIPKAQNVFVPLTKLSSCTKCLAERTATLHHLKFWKQELFAFFKQDETLSSTEEGKAELPQDMIYGWNKSLVWQTS